MKKKLISLLALIAFLVLVSPTSANDLSDNIRFYSQFQRAESQFKDPVNKAMCQYFSFFMDTLDVGGKKNREVLAQLESSFKKLRGINLVGAPRDFTNAVDDTTAEMIDLLEEMRKVVDGDIGEEEVYPDMEKFVNNYHNSIKPVIKSVKEYNEGKSDWNSSEDKKIWDELR